MRAEFRRRGERFEVVGDNFASCRKNVGRRRPPALPCEERGRCGVDAIAPRREKLDVAPIAQVRADCGTGLIDFHWETARDEMRGRGEADRARPDHGDGEMFEGWRFYILSFQYHRN
jgi:hypothetical protein